MSGSGPGASDPFDLTRFVAAQDRVWPDVCAELAAGCKRSHWMWFVFPQLKSLGKSPTAQHYGIASLSEARAYLAHLVLGPRLAEATRLVLAAAGSIHDVFGTPDDLKFCSSMTLFSVAAPGDDLFRRGIDRCPDGQPDAATLRILGETT